ncbi:CRISPR-associated helicase Cas3' [Stappia sp.]|uniref:CRISPR-associated helicase Cas3' n=1 Tax=Stappia sp. TaxID=1870903 RepID=UPI003D147921
MKPNDTAALGLFWAKTVTSPSLDSCPDTQPLAPLYKPVLHHFLDVAASALAWQSARPAFIDRLGARIGVNQDCLIQTSAFLAGLHDLGKISRSFQAKRPDLWPEAGLGRQVRVPERAHWRNTALLLRAGPLQDKLFGLFPGILGKDTDCLAPLIAAVAGHHGQPPTADELNAKPNDAAHDPQLGAECVGLARVAFQLLREIVGPCPLSGLTSLAAFKAWSWSLSGLVTLSDWIGSDAEHFPLQPVETPLPDYWALAQTQAKEALLGKGLMTSPIFSAPTLGRVSPLASRSPRPLQAFANAFEPAEGQQLVILEDTTGAGKTEAALVLAARMMAAGKGEGVFFALPTMATANAMYERLAGAYAALFIDGAQPSLVLAHGRAGLSVPFQASVGSPLANGHLEEETASRFCASWIADSRKKCFFADVGAATIDQAFLAVLRKKHLTLRQLGLGGRILIVDEAHCFDAYMNEEMYTLLELQAMLGGSAIVLSATLTLKQKQNMAEAFGAGLGLRDAGDLREEIVSRDYPLATSVEAGGVSEHAPGFDVSLRRRVSVRRLGSREEAVTEALNAAADGAAVAIICNAVDEAISVHAEIRAHFGEKAHLFHARFAQSDRQAIEDEMLLRFGKAGTKEGRSGHVLVATQVIEQSLDLDFDLVISDLAPIDLLIQRAGRLWRHADKRPPATRPIAGPMLMVVSADPGAVSGADWLEPVLGKAAFTYRDPAILWRSAREAFSKGLIETPGDFRPMIEAVYTEADLSDVPPCLRARAQRAQGEASGQGSLGRLNVVDLQAGYAGLSGQLSADEDIGTRLGEPTVTLRLARSEAGRLVPWSNTADPATAWAMSEIRVRTKWLGISLPVADDEPRAALRKHWPEWEQQIPVAIVNDRGCVDFGRGSAADFRYHDTIGFRRNGENSPEDALVDFIHK